MAGSNQLNIHGLGALNYQRAIDIARSTEGDLNPAVSTFLEKALRDIWRRIQVQPQYILNQDEFAVFNYYAQRFKGNPQAEQAIARYWQHAHEQNANRS